MKKYLILALAGAAAGAVNGLMGTGGGMVLLPVLSLSGAIKEEEMFSSSVAIMFPICIVSLIASAFAAPLPFRDALPYLLGSIPGALLAGKFSNRIPVKWLHRILGAMILWGGIRWLF